MLPTTYRLPPTTYHLIDPLYPRPDTTEHFVRIRADGAGDLAHLDAVAALVPDDHCRVSGLHLHIGDVHRDHVHVDGAHDRRALAADEDGTSARHAAVETIRISGRHH